jgi:hypothetical protein
MGVFCGDTRAESEVGGVEGIKSSWLSQAHYKNAVAAQSSESFTIVGA